MEMDRVTAQLRAGVEPSSLSQIWSQGVHGRILACHARGRGSLPRGTAKLLFRDSTAVVQLAVNQLVVGSIPTLRAKPIQISSAGRANDR